MNNDEFENIEKTSQFIKNGLIKDELPASFNQRLMQKIRQKELRMQEFSFFGLRPAYALATILIILSLVFFFFAPFKNKTTIIIPQQTAIYFTDEDHHEVENIFLTSNTIGEDETLIDLFANNNSF